MVEHVIAFRAEADLLAFGDLEALDQRHIQFVKPRVAENITPRIADLEGRSEHCGELRDLRRREVVNAATLLRYLTDGSAGAGVRRVGCAARERRVLRCDGERIAALIDQRATDVPAADGGIEEFRHVAAEFLSVTDRKRVGEQSVQRVTPVEVADGAVQMQIVVIDGRSEPVAFHRSVVDALAEGVVGRNLNVFGVVNQPNLHRVVVRTAVVRAENNCLELRIVPEVIFRDARGVQFRVVGDVKRVDDRAYIGLSQVARSDSRYSGRGGSVHPDKQVAAGNRCRRISRIGRQLIERGYKIGRNLRLVDVAVIEQLAAFVSNVSDLEGIVPGKLTLNGQVIALNVARLEVGVENVDR